MKRLKSAIDNGNCGDLIKQYKEYAMKIQSIQNPDFTRFDPSTNIIDQLSYSTLSANQDFNKVWSVAKMLHGLSHGSASAERGFC